MACHMFRFTDLHLRRKYENLRDEHNPASTHLLNTFYDGYSGVVKKEYEIRTSSFEWKDFTVCRLYI